jgi:hypothetical protein
MYIQLYLDLVGNPTNFQAPIFNVAIQGISEVAEEWQKVLFINAVE